MTRKGQQVKQSAQKARPKTKSIYQIKDIISKRQRDALRKANPLEYISKSELESHIMESVQQAVSEYGFSKNSIRRMEPDKMATINKLISAKVKATIEENRVPVEIAKELRRNLRSHIDIKYITKVDIDRIVGEVTDKVSYDYHGTPLNEIKDNILIESLRRTTDHIQNQIVAKRGIEELTKKEIRNINRTVPIYGQWKAQLRKKIERGYKRSKKKAPEARAMEGAIGNVIKQWRLKILK